MLETPAPIYAGEEARESIARHAAVGDRLDAWADQRRARREQDAMRAALGEAMVTTDT